MRDFKQKKKIRNRIYSKGVLAVLGVAAVFLGNATWNVYQKYREADEKTAIAQAQLYKLNTREEQLSDSLVSLKTDIGVEKELREKFGVVKEGEQMILIVNKQEGNSEESSNEHQNIWQMFLNLFK